MTGLVGQGEFFNGSDMGADTGVVSTALLIEHRDDPLAGQA